MGRDCRQHFLIAAGSNAELRAALDVCDAFGYMQPEIYRQLDRQLDSVAAMLYRLTH
jgi:four helix bundle protein